MNQIFLFLPLLAGLGVLLWLWRRERQLRLDAIERMTAERAEAERAVTATLRERSVQLETILDQMLEALIAVDARGHIQLANRATSSIFNLQTPLLGRRLLEVVRHHEIGTVMERLRQEREVRNHEIRIEGVLPRVLQVNAVAMVGGGALLVIHDVTELRRLESLRQDFVANVSHELRTPISLIRGAVETLLDGAKDDPEARDKFLGIIDRHGARLGLLIEDLLLLSALDSGRIELHTQPLTVRDAVQEVVDDLAGSAKARNTVVTNSVPPDLQARADTLRLRQVLSNLIDNAIKYGRENGQVAITAERLSPEWLQMAVRDDGPGIPVEARERIFERFFRVDKARARQQGGTGLGLAIVKNLVLAHGGDVRVESAEGRGTAFYFKLPIA